MRSHEQHRGRQVQHLALADARQVPWSNGRGVTSELAVWPPGASLERADFDWRIASAPVDEPGPFSVLPGIERILVLTEGAGLELAHGDLAPRARLRRLEPYRFSGAWPTVASLPAGGVRDFNVMFAPDRVDVQVAALGLGGRRLREALRPGQAFVHALGGQLTARVTGEEQSFELEPGDSLWVRGLSGGEELDLTGRSPDLAVLLVTLAQA
ncbi:MAG: HutD family protein [Planctomycetota bacterium]|nr:HutD family protein [Planctomycetota bacterium]